MERGTSAEMPRSKALCPRNAKRKTVQPLHNEFTELPPLDISCAAHML